MANDTDDDWAQIQSTLKQVLEVITRMHARQLETSDLLMDACNGTLSLDDVGDLQNGIASDRKKVSFLLASLGEFANAPSDRDRVKNTHASAWLSGIERSD